MFRLLVLWVTVVLVVSLDEREFDPKVAPPQNTVPKPFQLWRNFASQVRRVFSNLQAKTTPPPPPTAKVRMRSTTTPEPELQYYGALNPIYQTGNF